MRAEDEEEEEVVEEEVVEEKVVEEEVLEKEVLKMDPVEVRQVKATSQNQPNHNISKSHYHIIEFCNEAKAKEYNKKNFQQISNPSRTC